MPPPRFVSALALEARYDGPIAPADPALAFAPRPAGRGRLFHRLAAAQQAGLARRRAGCPAAAVLADPTLAAGQRLLRCYRDQGAAWTALETGQQQRPPPPPP